MECKEYAVVTHKEWYLINKSLFESLGAATKYTDTGRGSATLEIDTDKHIMQVTAWNHASCLNIEILDIKSEVSNYITEGACEDKAIFDQHLQNYLAWFSDEYDSTA